MGFREGLLALLEAGPRHGYGLKRAFEAATGGAWELNVGQVYAALQKLERDGEVAFDGEEDGRKRYRLTDLGRRRATRWAHQEPVPHALRDRDELTMKVLLVTWLDPERVHATLATQRAATMARLQEHTRQKAATPADQVQQLVHLDRSILHARAELDWLEVTEQRMSDAPAGTGRDTGVDARATRTDHDDVAAGVEEGTGT